jgi:hypothetical protein
MDWISLVQNRERLLAHVNMVFNIRVPKQEVYFLNATLYHFHKNPAALAVVIS